MSYPATFAQIVPYVDDLVDVMARKLNTRFRQDQMHRRTAELACSVHRANANLAAGVEFLSDASVGALHYAAVVMRYRRIYGDAAWRRRMRSGRTDLRSRWVMTE